MKKLLMVMLVCLICALTVFAEGISEKPAKEVELRDTAVFNNFIIDDPLMGDNGLTVSPIIDPDRYGPINIMLDVDGNAVEATVTSDISYFEGKYYLYCMSSAYGAFDIAPGASMAPTLQTDPNSWYRPGGLVIYESDDLMNWRLKGRYLMQNPYTGSVYIPKKTRVVYSEKTGLYVMWHTNGQSSPSRGNTWLITTSETPYGPWSEPDYPTCEFDPTLREFTKDFDLGMDEQGNTWLVRSHGVIDVYRLNDEKTGVVEKISTNADTSILNGGIGIHYENGWWYITGDHGGGNPIASNLVYIMARDPSGPWLSPDTAEEMENQPQADVVTPAVIAADGDSGYTQPNGSSSLPDSDGHLHTFMPAKHYISSLSGAPDMKYKQPGDSNLALAGQCFIVFEYDDYGHILPLTDDSIKQYEFPLAKEVETTVPAPYQAALTITNEQSVVQTWTVDESQTVAAILPSVFQRTQDPGPVSAKGNPPQDPSVSEPLIAIVTTPSGDRYEYIVDTRTIRWNPQQIVLGLPEPVYGGGQFSLELKTIAENGAYGVAVGERTLDGTYLHVSKSGEVNVYPNASMMLKTVDVCPSAPVIIEQPRSVTAVSGEEVGFVVVADGIGLGYQWTKDGEILIAPDGFNESDNLMFRIHPTSKSNSGIYQVAVFNSIGEVKSEPVELYMVDLIVESDSDLSDSSADIVISNKESVPVSYSLKSAAGILNPGESVQISIPVASDAVLGDSLIEYSFSVDGKPYNGTYRLHYGAAIGGN